MGSAASSLTRAIAGATRDEGSAVRIQSIFGTRDAGTIAARVVALVRRELDSAPVGCRLVSVSTGVVFGLPLADGREVAVKARAPDFPLERLRAVCQVQTMLARRGFPCPTPLVPPVPFGRGHATFDTFLEPGSPADPRLPMVRRAMAEALAKLMVLARDLPTPAALAIPRSPTDDLWPNPHRADIDFAATRRGAEWIDRIARSASRQVAGVAGPPLVGHVDWTARNVRLAGERVRAVFDWDSVVLSTETELVGAAAVMFTETVPGVVETTRKETRSFVREYERARSVPFTRRERARIDAAATFLIAYGARCEHALDPEARQRVGFRRELAARHRRAGVPRSIVLGRDRLLRRLLTWWRR